MDEHELMTITEVAKAVRGTDSGVRWQITNQTGVGRLFAKVGRRQLARRADVEAYIADRFAQAQSELEGVA